MFYFISPTAGGLVLSHSFQEQTKHQQQQQKYNDGDENENLCCILYVFLKYINIKRQLARAHKILKNNKRKNFVDRQRKGKNATVLFSFY